MDFAGTAMVTTGAFAGRPRRGDGGKGAFSARRSRLAQIFSVPGAKPRPDENCAAVCPLARHAPTRSAQISAVGRSAMHDTLKLHAAPRKTGPVQGIRYIGPIPSELTSRFGHVAATLVKVSR